MARKRRYHPQANPVKWALMAANHQAQLDETAIAELFALQALQAGTATPDDLRRLTFMVEMSRQLGRIGIGPEALPLCDAITAANGFDLPLLRDLMGLHGQQREAATAAQYLRAMYRI